MSGDHLHLARQRERWCSLDYYGALGLEPDCSVMDVNRGFIAVASKCRPEDVPPEEWQRASNQFQLIAEAYEVLSRDRHRYDEARKGVLPHVAPVPHLHSRHWSWPAWCLKEIAPGIEVLVQDEEKCAVWVKAFPRQRIRDPRTREDMYITCTYHLNGHECSNEFGPDNVRRCGETHSIASWSGPPLSKKDIMASLGFELSAAKAALSRCSSVEAAIYYLMSKSAAAEGDVHALARVLSRRNSNIVFL